jgi:ABC-type transport system involved in multi-copper enzyme maturation permease subunit
MPVSEWLLGPTWYDGVLFRPTGLLVAVPVVAVVLYLVGRMLRRGPIEVSPRAATIIGTTVGGLLVFSIATVVFWCLDLKITESLTTQGILRGIGSPLLRLLAWLLGSSWYSGTIYSWALLVTGVAGSVFLIGWVVSALVGGPIKATARVGRILIEVFFDLARTSPRRVLALTWLAVRESIRRKVVVVFAVFVALLLFGGWYLNPGSDQPTRLYLQFVLTATSYLVLLLAWILSSLSLPADIKEHTLYTVVTKPVRQTEIVLGRVLGFTVIGTGLLLGMGAISYIFTIRGLQHTHELTASDLHDEPVPGNQKAVRKGLTSRSHRHQHEVTIDPSGDVAVEMKQGHWHKIEVEGTGDNVTYHVGPPQGMLLARVPVYGRLHFKDRAGKDSEKGINVGDEWTYRSFIAGGTRAAAIWSFDGITEDMFPESDFAKGIPLEMTIEVFRTYKGDVEKPILGSLWVQNPQTSRKVIVCNFLAKKFATDVQWIPRTLKDGIKKETVDLFRDMVSTDGRLDIGIQCLENQQYFGMAQADAYLRAGDASFPLNFVKGYVGIWLQMVMVMTIGVMFSTFLGGPVAMLATLAAIVGGMFSPYVTEIAVGKLIGGGPFESFIRLVTQQNMISEMEPGLETNAAQMGDKALQVIFWIVSSVLPSFDSFDYVDHVAFGFNVGAGLLLKGILQAAAFVFPVVVAGYFFLKMREVAK